MNRIRCNYCGKLFDTPDTYEDYRGEFHGASAYETMYCCPYCHSDDIENVECDEYGIFNEIEIFEFIDDENKEFVKYTSDWYYEKCDKKCNCCRFYDKKYKYCKWEAGNE